MRFMYGDYPYEDETFPIWKGTGCSIMARYGNRTGYVGRNLHPEGRGYYRRRSCVDGREPGLGQRDSHNEARHRGR